MDPASSEFFRDGNYDLGIKDKTSAKLTPDGLADLYRELIAKYPLVLLEDPFAEDDFPSWTSFMEKNEGGPEVVGDDLTVCFLSFESQGTLETYPSMDDNALLTLISRSPTWKE